MYDKYDNAIKIKVRKETKSVERCVGGSHGRCNSPTELYGLKQHIYYLAVPGLEDHSKIRDTHLCSIVMEEPNPDLLTEVPAIRNITT